MTKAAPRTIARLRLVGAAVLAGVACTAVVGLGYASANGPAASAKQYQYKVTICHHTGSQSNPHVTITVSSRSLKAHERHGDTPSACTTTLSVTTHSRPAHVKKFHKGTTLSAELRSEKGNKGKGKGKGK